jgi:DNA gyrase subunit A
MGRATQGVRLINIKNNDAIASVAVVPVEDEEEAQLSENGEPIVDGAMNDQIIDNNDADNTSDNSSDDNNEDGTTIE